MEPQDSHSSTQQNPARRSSGANNMSNTPKPSAVKCLFPDPDFDKEAQHDSLNILQDMIAADVERMRTKWNYDSENDRPLDGAVKWEKPDDPRYDWIGYIVDRLDEDNSENEALDYQVDEVNPRCKTKAADEIVDAAFEGPKKP